jgi:hypothetical protein
MIKYFCILLIFFFGASDGFAQKKRGDRQNTSSSKLLFKGLKIQYGSSLNFHLKDKDPDDPNIPDRFESIEERPSIAAFFNAGYGPIFDLSMDIQSVNNTHNMFILGISYGRFSYKNTVRSSENLFGENLKTYSISPYIGFGGYGDDKKNMLFYGFIGPSFQNFEGSSLSGARDFVHVYRTSGFWKGGVRLEVDGDLTPLFVTAGLEFQIGDIFLNKNKRFKMVIKLVNPMLPITSSRQIVLCSQLT